MWCTVKFFFCSAKVLYTTNEFLCISNHFSLFHFHISLILFDKNRFGIGIITVKGKIDCRAASSWTINSDSILKSRKSCRNRFLHNLVIDVHRILKSPDLMIFTGLVYGNLKSNLDLVLLTFLFHDDYFTFKLCISFFIVFGWLKMIYRMAKGSRTKNEINVLKLELLFSWGIKWNNGCAFIATNP